MILCSIYSCSLLKIVEILQLFIVAVLTKSSTIISLNGNPVSQLKDNGIHYIARVINKFNLHYIDFL